MGQILSYDCLIGECSECGDDDCMHTCHRDEPREPAIAKRQPASADAHLGAVRE